MKKIQKFFALTLALVMIFSVGIIFAAAEDNTTNTEIFLTELAKTKKLYAKVTSHSYDDRIDTLDFDFYDDLNTDTICCNLNDKGIKAVYRNGNVDCVFTRFFCYISASLNKVPFMKSTVESVEILQNTISEFLDDPHLSSFNKEVTVVERNGKLVTKEKFIGKLLTVSGSFYYDENNNLCELELTDTLGESIGFTLENVSVSFNQKVFDVPSYYFNLSFIWKFFGKFLSGIFFG